MKKINFVCVLIILGLFLPSCADNSEDKEKESEAVSIEISGFFRDDYFQIHNITSKLWIQKGFGTESRFHILEIDNKAKTAIAQNDPDNMFSPDKYSRFDWAENEGQIYFCQTIYDAETIDEAIDAQASDPELLDTGCNSFPWSKLNESIFANKVVDYSPLPITRIGEQFFESELILGQPVEGLLNVVSLGFDSSQSNTSGGSITVEFGKSDQNYCIVNGIDTDFVVYENSFDSEEGTYNEAAYVEVSENGIDFYRYPYSINEETPANMVERYSGLAGINPDGDNFDLQNIIDEYILPEDFKACQVKIIDAGTEIIDYDTGHAVSDGSGADIDAIEVINYVISN